MNDLIYPKSCSVFKATEATSSTETSHGQTLLLRYVGASYHQDFRRKYQDHKYTSRNLKVQLV